MKSIILCLVLFGVIQCLNLGPCTLAINNPNCGVTVEVGAYTESLCPDCKAFVVNQLLPTFNKLINANPPILTINMVPFGKAQMTFNKNATKNPSLNFTCQHKDQECEGNIIQSCSVVRYDIEKSLPFVTCMFNSTNWKTPWNSAKECSQKLGLDFNVLSECANSLDGVAIEFLMAGQTNALEPKLDYVPWITINGKHSDEIQQKAETNLLKLVCDTYPEFPKPKPCDSA